MTAEPWLLGSGKDKVLRANGLLGMAVYDIHNLPAAEEVPEDTAAEDLPGARQGSRRLSCSASSSMALKNGREKDVQRKTEEILARRRARERMAVRQSVRPMPTDLSDVGHVLSWVERHTEEWEQEQLGEEGEGEGEGEGVEEARVVRRGRELQDAAAAKRGKQPAGYLEELERKLREDGTIREEAPSLWQRQLTLLEEASEAEAVRLRGEAARFDGEAITELAVASAAQRPAERQQAERSLEAELAQRFHLEAVRRPLLTRLCYARRPTRRRPLPHHSS